MRLPATKWLAGLVLGLAACTDQPAAPRGAPSPPPPPPPPPAARYVLAAVAGDAQTVAAGTAVPIAPAVRLTTMEGMAVPLAEVQFAVVEGGGSLAGASTRTVLTDQDGVARAAWTLGTTAGGNTLSSTAAHAANAVAFSALGTPGPLAKLVPVIVGNFQRVTLSLGPIVVRAVDQYDNGVSGVTVTFTLGPEGGALSAPTQVESGRDGLALGGRWTMSTKAGPHTLIASAAGIDPLVMTVTAIAGPPAGIVIARGNAQIAVVLTKVPIEPTVRVLDTYGNSIFDRIEVWFRPGAGPDTVGPQLSMQTDGNGEAHAPWQLGRRPGSYELNVSTRTGELTVSFTATAVAGPPARLLPFEGDRQTAPVNSTLPVRPAVQVADTWGNRLAVAGIPVTFMPFGNSGGVSGGTQVTDASGVARVGAWTIGPDTVAFGNLLRSTSPGLWEFTFLATGTAP